ncbi:hypothetical protein [Legionella fairfieldensis]|uniref:hypothetical protein n=1 Tax=Legionella fairfieldensis TaxID=45064 RepID=UPI00048AE34C|nr:hypothetical protein [Legionella fairfieldensis]
MSLPTTKRGSNQLERAPDSKAIRACIAVATTPEAAFYLKERFPIVMKGFGTVMVEKSKAIREALQDYYDNISLQRLEQSGVWKGQLSTLNEFQNLQHNWSRKIADDLNTKIKGNIKMDVAISDESQLVRGFSVDGTAVSKDRAVDMDKLFTAWLAKNNLLSQNGLIYEGTESGQIRHDEEGNPLKANPEEIKQLMDDKEKGFSRFSQDLGIQITIQQHAYPEQENVAPAV